MLPLVVIIVVYGLTAVFSGMNIGIRHILPLFAPCRTLRARGGMVDGGERRRFRPAETANSATLEAATATAMSRANDIEPSPPAGWPSCPDGALLCAMCVAVYGALRVVGRHDIARVSQLSGVLQPRLRRHSYRGYKHLVDSSLDWGQDLGAKEYLDQEGSSLRPKSRSTFLTSVRRRPVPSG